MIPVVYEGYVIATYQSGGRPTGSRLAIRPTYPRYSYEIPPDEMSRCERVDCEYLTFDSIHRSMVSGTRFSANCLKVGTVRGFSFVMQCARQGFTALEEPMHISDWLLKRMKEVA